MLVDPEFEIGSSDPERRRDEGARPPRAATLMLLLVAAALGAGAYRLAAGSFSRARVRTGRGRESAIRRSCRWPRHRARTLAGAGQTTVAPVAAKDIKRDLVLPAVVEADPARLIKVSPPLAGRVTQLKVELGERVAAGQPLVVIDSPDLAAAYSDYDRAKVLLALALKSRDRQRGLGENRRRGRKGSAAGRNRLCHRRGRVPAGRQRTSNRSASTPEDANKSRTVTVVAPMAGSVIDLGVAPGEFWNDPTAALMTVADLSTIWVTASVPEKDTALVAKGQSVDVVFAAYPGRDVQGPGAVRQRCPRSRHAPHQGPHRLRQIPVRDCGRACSPRSASMRRRSTLPVVPTSALLAKGRRHSGLRRNSAVDVRGAQRRHRFPAGRPGRSHRRRQAGRPRRRQRRSAAR